MRGRRRSMTIARATISPPPASTARMRAGAIVTDPSATDAMPATSSRAISPGSNKGCRRPLMRAAP